MNEEMKKSEEVKNEENNEATEQNTEQKTEVAKVLTSEGQIEMFGKGKMELAVPILSRSVEITEIFWDFTKINGREYVEALDRDVNARNTFVLTSTQALYLFAKAVEKATNDLDAKDIVERISAQDCIQAVQLATVFFTASRRAANSRISKA